MSMQNDRYTLRFQFDFISPYAWFAWHDLPALAARYGRTIEPIPVLFAAMLDAHGQLGPAEIPSKRRYTFKDCVRTARRLGIPFEAPPAHPFNPLTALRVASLPDATPALITDLYAEVWCGGRGVSDPAVVAEIAARHGLPDALEQAAQPAIKALLRDRTDAAISEGVFGVPSIWADGELFWGHDSLPNLEHHLAGNPLEPSAWQPFVDLPSQAHRRR